MSQIVRYWVGDTEHRRVLPGSEELVMPGIPWGEHSSVFTPAYWVSQLWMGGLDRQPHSPYKASGSLAEELTFCLLGGFGITAELATATFKACHEAGLVSNLNALAEDWSKVLRQPVNVGGRTVHYRYPNQKAIYLAQAMKFLRTGRLDIQSGRQLRDSLLQVQGIGPKTAGWIARNYFDADDVAILDIHIVRAGILCGLFLPEQRVEKNYFDMEDRYIQFCSAMDVRPAVLDCLIWDQMRTVGQFAIDAVRLKLGQPKLRANPTNGSRPTQLRLHLTH